MKIKDVTKYLESIAPSAYQEGYDNSGLIVGHPCTKVKGVLICLDSLESIIDEAIDKKCNLVIAHHPIVFKGLKRFNGRDYVERTIIKAIKNDIAIYAIHTNLDNVKQGVNAKISEKLNLINTKILSPKNISQKLNIFLPISHTEAIKKALFKIGAGSTDSRFSTSYSSLGASSKGKKNLPQVKLEIHFPKVLKGLILSTLSYELKDIDFNYDILDVDVKHSGIGSGMIGELKKEMDTLKFLTQLKKTMGTGCVKYTNVTKKKIKKVAVCGGSGSFLLSKAIRKKADIFITSDFKYHEFFDADSQIIIADIGHYETEQYTIDLLYKFLTKKFSTFAILKTNINTNPVNYL